MNSASSSRGLDWCESRGGQSRRSRRRRRGRGAADGPLQRRGGHPARLGRRPPTDHVPPARLAGPVPAPHAVRAGRGPGR